VRDGGPAVRDSSHRHARHHARQHRAYLGRGLQFLRGHHRGRCPLVIGMKVADWRTAQAMKVAEQGLLEWQDNKTY